MLTYSQGAPTTHSTRRLDKKAFVIVFVSDSNPPLC
jgi:hypothetical protein